MNTRLLLGAAASLALAGCGLKNPPAGADIMPDSARAQIPGKWAGPHRSGNVVPNWIRTFGDPTLTALVADAVARNPDLAAAAALVEASRAAVRVAAAALYPQIAMKGLGERQWMELQGSLDKGIDPGTLGSLGVESTGGSTSNRSIDSSSQRWVYGLGLGAAWELDVWGRVRSKTAAAKADSASLEADYEYARQSLAAAVARAYFSTIEAAQQEANAQETLGLYEDYTKLTDDRKKQGHASDFDVAQIKSRTAGARDALYAAQAARAQAIRAIEVVTSRYPAGKLGVRRSFPGQPKAVPAGLPAQILERRPDVVAAERRFAAAFHRTNEARTARLPRLALSGVGGLASSQLDGVGTLDSLSWSLAGGVFQPIFLGGALKAAQDIRTSEQKAAVASYISVALRAFQDVENALANDYYLRKREGALNDMVENSAQTVTLGRKQLEQGQADMFTILRLSGENLAAKIELTKIRASRLRERVNLHLALGGDFKGYEFVVIQIGSRLISSSPTFIRFMASISNDYSRCKLVRGKAGSGKGPVALMQRGTDPADSSFKEKTFFLQRDGSWISDVDHGCRPIEQRFNILFDSSADVMKLLDEMTGDVKFERVNVSNEQLQTYTTRLKSTSIEQIMQDFIREYLDRKRSTGGT